MIKKIKQKEENKIIGRFDVLIRQKSIAELSRLFDCNQIELINNHIMIYKKGRLIFKVWLDKEDYKDLKKVMKKIGMSICRF